MHCIVTVSQTLPGLNLKIVFRQLRIAELNILRSKDLLDSEHTPNSQKQHWKR